MSKCILVVEDQEDNRRILRDLLCQRRVRADRSRKRRGGAYCAHGAAPRPDLDGHSTAGDGRLRSNAAYPPQSGVKIDPHHCYDRLRAGRRRGQGSGCGLHCLRHQTVQSACVACESARALSPCRVTVSVSTSSGTLRRRRSAAGVRPAPWAGPRYVWKSASGREQRTMGRATKT